MNNRELGEIYLSIYENSVSEAVEYDQTCLKTGGKISSQPTKSNCEVDKRFYLPSTPTKPSPTQTPKPSAAPGTVAVSSGRGGSVSVNKEYDATLGGKPVKVSYDASGKRTVRPVVSTPSAPSGTAPSPPAPSAQSSTSSTTPTASLAPEKTYQQKLDDLRAAAAKATLTGPSKEAQALISQRTKNLLGPEKLEAGIKAQQEVEKMKNEIGSVSTNQPQQSQQPSQTSRPTTVQSTSLTPEQIKKYNQAVGSLQNPILSGVARGRVRDEYNSRSPEQQSQFREYLKGRPPGEQKLFDFLKPSSVKEHLNKNRSRLTEEMKSGSNQYSNLVEAYKQVYEQIGVPDEGDVKGTPQRIIENTPGLKVPSRKNIIVPGESKPSSQVKQAEEYSIYDEVLEYLLSEGYSEDESNRIMVNLVNEGGLQDFMKAVQHRTGIGKPGSTVKSVIGNIARAGLSDIAGVSILGGGSPTTKAPTAPKAPPKVQTPTPIVQQATRAPRTSPRGANIAPDPWKSETSTPRTQTTTPTTQPRPTPTARPALPPGTRGGALATTRAPKPTFKPEALPKPSTPTAQPGGALATTRAPKPTFKPEALPKPSTPTAQRGGALATTRAPKPTFKPEALPGQKPSVPSTPQRTPRTGTRALPPARSNPITSADITTPKPTAKPIKQDKIAAQAAKSVKPTIRSRRPGGLDSLDLGGKQGFSLPFGGAHLGAAVAGLQAYNTADATRKSAPKVPTTAKEVKKGETYYDPSTRVGSTQRFSQRLKVGPKLVGKGTVGTEAQNFDKAYGAAKSAGKTEFTWKGKNYSV